MYARVSIYEIPDDQRTEAEASFEEALAKISELEGLQDAYFLLGVEGERAMAVTFWDSHQTMTASRVVASRLRSEAANSVDGGIVSVDEYQVVKHTGAAAS